MDVLSIAKTTTWHEASAESYFGPFSLTVYLRWLFGHCLWCFSSGPLLIPLRGRGSTRGPGRLLGLSLTLGREGGSTSRGSPQLGGARSGYPRRTRDARCPRTPIVTRQNLRCNINNCANTHRARYTNTHELLNTLSLDMFYDESNDTKVAVDRHRLTNSLNLKDVYTHNKKHVQYKRSYTCSCCCRTKMPWFSRQLK